MNVSKLTIAPLTSFAPKVVFYNPTTEHAQQYILEAMVSARKTSNRKIPKGLRRIPNHLKGFINPKTKVINSVDCWYKER